MCGYRYMGLSMNTNLCFMFLRELRINIAAGRIILQLRHN